MLSKRKGCGIDKFTFLGGGGEWGQKAGKCNPRGQSGSFVLGKLSDPLEYI